MEKRHYPRIYRLLHWAIALCTIFLLITIFLRLNWMNRDNMVTIMEDYLASHDGQLPREDVVAMAKRIRQPMWDWHVITGYILAGLIAVRMTLPAFGQMKFANPLRSGLSVSEKIRYWSYVVFYACFLGSIITGLLVEFGSEEVHEAAEEIHVLSLWYLLPFVIIHLAGVFRAEFTSDKGIISRIISGSAKDGKD